MLMHKVDIAIRGPGGSRVNIDLILLGTMTRTAVARPLGYAIRGADLWTPHAPSCFG